MRRRGERPGHSATTAHFQAAYPFLGMGGLGAPGVYVGTDAFGGAWAFDPWELYARRIMRSPNVIVLGGISYAKSTLIKTYIYRQYLFGRQAWVIDVKGEYGPLAAALGRHRQAADHHRHAVEVAERAGAQHRAAADRAVLATGSGPAPPSVGHR